MSVSLSFYLYGCVVILCNFAHDYALAGYQYAKRVIRWKYFLDLVLYLSYEIQCPNEILENFINNEDNIFFIYIKVPIP